jgi:hypothetical protein
MITKYPNSTVSLFVISNEFVSFVKVTRLSLTPQQLRNKERMLSGVFKRLRATGIHMSLLHPILKLIVVNWNVKWAAELPANFVFVLPSESSSWRRFSFLWQGPELAYAVWLPRTNAHIYIFILFSYLPQITKVVKVLDVSQHVLCILPPPLPAIYMVV